MTLMKWQYNKICQFLAVDIYYFLFSLTHSFKKKKKKIKRWKLASSVIDSLQQVA